MVSNFGHALNDNAKMLKYVYNVHHLSVAELGSQVIAVSHQNGQIK